MDSKKKGNWTNENGFINIEDINIKLASPKSLEKFITPNKLVFQSKPTPRKYLSI